MTGAPVRYFRHPYLHTGKTLEDKRALEQWLRGHGYIIAPITIDTPDYIYAALYARAKNDAETQRIRADYLRIMEDLFAFYEQRSREVLGREIAQTLLIRASQLNAECLPSLIAMMKRRGYRIVSLTEALKDPYTPSMKPLWPIRASPGFIVGVPARACRSSGSRTHPSG